MLLPMQKRVYVMNCRIMNSPASPVIIIPARMAAARLPGKPLADIAGKPMIQHVWERAVAADLAPVWVATDDDGIADAVRAAGGQAVITRADHPSGSDRVFEAVERIDPDRHHDAILNLQGDLPELDAAIPHRLLSAMGDETEYVTEYRARHPDFPHETTLDQFFDEAQFEAYRALGYHIASKLFDGRALSTRVSMHLLFACLSQFRAGFCRCVTKLRDRLVRCCLRRAHR